MKLILGTLFTILIFNFTIAQDWANLEKYKDNNAQLMTMSTNDRRIVFMGNSITEGWGQDSSSFFNTKFYTNRGIGGQTTPQMLLRFRADVIDIKAKVVVILAGINDIAGNTGPMTLEQIAGNLISMAELARANNIKVILCSVLPAYDFPWRPGLNPAEKVVKLNNMIKEYVDKNGMIYLDYYHAMVDSRKGLKEEYTYDGVHPNAAGYRVMEPLAEQAIAKTLNSWQLKFFF